MTSLSREINIAKNWVGLAASGVVTHVIGLLIESNGPFAHIGELCYVYNKNGEALPCEVVGFKENKVLLMSLGEMTHIAPGAEVYPTRNLHTIAVSHSMCGRILDALGNPLDGRGPIRAEKYYPAIAAPPHVLTRHMITEPFATGIKSIDATCTAGRGQRFGVFASAGVGKSTLLGMIAKSSDADINVIALIGERGREVREFIERELGPEGLTRSVVIVATSDQAALLRSKGANTAIAIAEYFRDQGLNVAFMMDSITRYAMALREIGLAIGEPPTTRGYTPSVFATLPKLLERAGNSDKGSMTGIYTILIEGDELQDPLADMVRAILDGHIMLSRKLASANQYPPVDVLGSISRVMNSVTTPEQYERAGKLRDLMQTYKEIEDLLNIGAYVPGSNPKADRAIALMPKIRAFLRQKSSESFTLEQTEALLKEIIDS